MQISVGTLRIMAETHEVAEKAGNFVHTEKEDIFIYPTGSIEIFATKPSEHRSVMVRTDLSVGWF